ncbi:hydroxypyruvate isomerase family protein [Acuticoccus yangtzensis]|uniref:hydroxypyruvate isomerase family protein n=1 Tax=Acuticoccus yangtzensis TaxID=1443441 RepID=UPI0009497915|nr:TIM barrel protein [Acuticoccus yangtzensis]
MKFSANLGFLWADLPLPEAIRAAKAAGFDAVECHWPYDVPPADVAAALAETGLPMLGLNTRRGAPGENGLLALPGREADARAAIEEAIAYARAIQCGAIHVMAGFASGPDAARTYRDNLAFACAAAPEITMMIEPLNRHDAPGYFLTTTAEAAAVIGDVAAPNLKLMFDCYHVGRMEGDITTRFAALLPLIGHVQFAAVPDRGAPDHGELDFGFILPELVRLGWDRPLGAEYKPGGETGATLGWLERFR